MSVLVPGSEVTCDDCDLNKDGWVGFPDLTKFLSEWGYKGKCVSDIDRNSFVDFADFTCLLSQYGTVCPESFGPLIPVPREQ